MLIGLPAAAAAAAAAAGGCAGLYQLQQAVGELLRSTGPMIHRPWQPAEAVWCHQLLCGMLSGLHLQLPVLQ